MAPLENILVYGALPLLSLGLGCNKRTFPTDTGIEGRVVIDPATPTVTDNLQCYVEGYEDSVFDFYWFRNCDQISVGTGESSILQSCQLRAGDTVICCAWTPASAWYDTFEYGCATADIQ